MKRSKAVLLVAVLPVALTGCTREVPGDRPTEEQLVSEMIFSGKMLDKNVYFEVDCTDSVPEKGDMLVVVVSRESPVRDSTGWVELGTACDSEQIMNLYNDVLKRCGKNEFQVNVDVPDAEGCRKVRFRSPVRLL